VISADGHPVAGTVALSLRKASTQAAPALADPLARGDLWLATALMSQAPSLASRFTPPPRALEAVAMAEAQVAQEVRTHFHSSGIMADFQIVDLATAPKAIVMLYPETPDADIRAVTILLTPPVADAVPLALVAVPGDDDTWTAATPVLGDVRWTALVEVRVGFDLAKLKGVIRIGAPDAG
jgi:hypothetical protein